MDADRFATVLRAFTGSSSRRGALRVIAGLGLAGLLTEAEVEARRKKRKKKRKKKKRCSPNCIDRTCGSNGCGGSCGECGATQVCQGGTCCTPEPVTTTCGLLCGTRTNNCGQSVTCPNCPGSQDCLSNGTCADVCLEHSHCPMGCVCETSITGGPKHCLPPSGCADVPIVCTSTAGCPPGHQCVETSCGPDFTPEGRCYPLCES